MRVGLLDVDGSNFPNIPLMKISAYHKQRGDDVHFHLPLMKDHLVYASKVFTWSVEPSVVNADKYVLRGTGSQSDEPLPDEIEHIYPDYELYPQFLGTAYGFLTRGCPRGCPFCIVAGKEGRKSRKVANLSEFWKGQKYINLCDPNILACSEHLDLLEQLADSKAYVDFNQGLDCRLLTAKNCEYLKRIRTSLIHFAWDMESEEKSVLRGLQFFAEQFNVSKNKHIVYVLCNFNTSHEYDLYRIYTLRNMGFAPYVMVFNKADAPKITRHLARWVNNRRIFYTVPDFKDYICTISQK